MQVKKFEARTMKEALEMVKTQLGPDAIILSARDNQKSFGLVGQGSVEITAAISEESLLKRKYAESKLSEQKKEIYQKSPARAQKEFIQKAYQSHIARQEPSSPTPSIRPRTSQRYVDIYDQEEEIQETPVQQPVNTRVKEAAQKAWNAMNIKDSDEILALKSEIASLKNLLSQFKSVPQNIVSSHPGANHGLPYEFSFLFEKLKNEGMEEKEIYEVLQFAKQTIPSHKYNNKALIEGFVAKRILDQTLIVDHQQSSAKFHFFVGPSGAGKTSALVKIASQKVVNENKKVALLTTDIFKIGAADQLRIFAQILNVPFAVIRNSQSWSQLQPHLDKMDHVFVDFPGYSLKKAEDVKVLEQLLPRFLKNSTTHLVLSAVGKFEDLNDMVLRYKTFKIDDLILSGIDECVQHGNIFSLMARNHLPLYGFGIGSKLPEDFEYATRERLLDLLFKITSNEKTQGSEYENLDTNN